MVDDSTKLYINEKAEAERQESAKLYAIKLVERIVFGAVGLIAVTVLGALVALVITK